MAGQKFVQMAVESVDVKNAADLKSVITDAGSTLARTAEAVESESTEGSKMNGECAKCFWQRDRNHKVKLTEPGESFVTSIRKVAAIDFKAIIAVGLSPVPFAAHLKRAINQITGESVKSSLNLETQTTVQCSECTCCCLACSSL